MSLLARQTVAPASCFRSVTKFAVKFVFFYILRECVCVCVCATCVFIKSQPKENKNLSPMGFIIQHCLIFRDAAQ